MRQKSVNAGVKIRDIAYTYGSKYAIGADADKSYDYVLGELNRTRAGMKQK